MPSSTAVQERITAGDGLDCVPVPDPLSQRAATASALGIRPSSEFVASSFPSSQRRASSAERALIRSLRASCIKFVRYGTVDACGTVRAKAVPLQRIASALSYDEHGGDRKSPFDGVVSIAEVCFAGLPSYADFMIPETGLDARRVLTVMPDLSSLRVLPYAPKTAMVMGYAHDQRTGQLSSLCTRGLLDRICKAAQSEFGIAVDVGAELEFCLFRNGEPVDSSVFAGTTTMNEQENFIDELLEQLRAQDIEVELVHSESASGQLEVVLTYQKEPMQLADNVFFARETVRAVAKIHGMRAIFLPKVAAMEAGNGCHIHFSIRDLHSGDPSQNALPQKGSPGEISRIGESFMEGMLDHLPALMALSIPTTNSFRRVGPGCWTGHRVGWGVEDKEAPIRACVDLKTGEIGHFEFKLSDSTANIYLELAVLIAAGLDGLRRGLKLRSPIINDGKELPPLPSTFSEALGALREDETLTAVLGPELSTAYIALREAEIKQSEGITLEEEVKRALRKD